MSSHYLYFWTLEYALIWLCSPSPWDNVLRFLCSSVAGGVFSVMFLPAQVILKFYNNLLKIKAYRIYVEGYCYFLILVTHKLCVTVYSKISHLRRNYIATLQSTKYLISKIYIKILLVLFFVVTQHQLDFRQFQNNKDLKNTSRLLIDMNSLTLTSFSWWDVLIY